MPTQSWVALTPSLPVADGTALANSTTLTSISPTPDITIPANFLTAGSRLRVTARGRFSTTGTPTLNLGLYYGGVGGVALAVSGALTCASGVTNLTFEVEFLVSVRTAGSSGTAMCTGHELGVTAATASATIPASAPAVATIDTTTAKALVLGATWGTASASNTITVHEWVVESLA